MDFNEWIHAELVIDPIQDVFGSDWARLAYYEQRVLSRFLNENKEKGGCGGCYVTTCSIMAQEILQFMSNFPCYKQLPAGTAGSCLSHGKSHNGASLSGTSSNCLEAKDSGRVNSRQLLVQFLHSCCDWLTRTDKPVTNTLWLYQVFHDHLQTLPKGSISINQAVSDFFSLQTTLPSYLFFKNVLQEDVKSAQLTTAVEYTNTYLKPHLSDGLVLPQATVSFILRALGTLGNNQLVATYLKVSSSYCQIPMIAIFLWILGEWLQM